MVETIHVQLLGPRDGDDLVEYMSSRGLVGTVTEARESSEIEVGYSLAREERLRHDLRKVLRDWVAERAGALVLSEVEDGRFVLRPPAE